MNDWRYNMLTVWILKGLPASGKSTWARAKVSSSNCAIKRVNKDDLRAMLDNGRHSKGNERFVLELRDTIIRKALTEGKHVIVDDTNFYPKHEEQIRNIAGEFDAQVKTKFFHIIPEEAIKRDLVRPNSVGAKVIWNMYHTYIKKEVPKKAQSFEKQDEKLPHAIICDLDGTIALMNGRSPYDYTKCDEDLPNKPIVDLVENYLSYKGDVIFLSGRDGRGREKTVKWLLENVQLMKGEFKLYMRQAEDNRKDCIIKKELYDEYIKGKYYIDFVLDDRNQVVELWRLLGLTCLQVAEGNF